MGSSKSKMVTPNNPLQELQLREFKRGQRKKQREKEMRNQRKMEERNLKRHLKLQKHQKISEPGTTSYQPNYDLSLQEYELKIEQFLRAQLENNLCGFILNQMSFTLQFFGNFEREISAAYEYIWKQKENELNQQFEDHSILMTNALDAAVERRVKYKPLHGPEKHQIQPLQAQTMYVVFENIDIARPNEANYDSLSPICKVDMETDFYKTTPCSENYAPLLEQTKWKGFVRLKLRDTQVENGSKATGNDKAIYSPAGSTTSTSSRTINIRNSFSSSSDYDYAYITHLNTHHPLVELTMTNVREKARVDAKVLPESCIADFQDYIEVPDDDVEEEEEDFDRNDDDQAEDVVSRFNLPPTKYLNSKEFMRYFGDLLRRKLASKLGLTESEFESGTYRGSSIYTRNYEIIPAIHVAHNAQSWPDCAFQFKRRVRPVVVHQLTRKQFQWPTPDMIKRIETFGFHVIPMGYAPKKSKNPYREIEWKIIFPKAERYLETTLTNTQIKVFMIAKALVKTFIERDNAMMFTIDHLRMHLFWECERNYVAWPEEFLGDVLLRFIRSFIDRLSRKCLPDFFIEGRNIFESIPNSSLVRLHAALIEIVENPVMHLIVALRNLTFLDDFIPRMDLKKIYNNLVENNYLKLRALSRNSKGALKLDEGSIDYWQMGDENAENQGLTGFTQQKDKGKKQLRRRTLLMKQNIEMLRRLDYERNRKSVDSINLEFVFNKNLKDSDKKKDINQGVENLRRTNILEIILDNLIAMAEACTETTENRSICLARVYLKQAKRLCKFYQIYGCDTGAIEYISKIESIESQIAILRNTESDMPPPALPIRTSLEPVKSFRSKDATEVKGNIYVRQVSRTKSESPTEPRRSIKFANPFEAKPMQVKATVHRPESLKKSHSQEDDMHTNKEPRRSIKFSDGKSSPTHMFRFDTDDEDALPWPEVPNGIHKSPEFKLKPRRPSNRVGKHTIPSDLSDTDSNSDYDVLRKPVASGHANCGTPPSATDSPQLSPSQGHPKTPPVIRVSHLGSATSLNGIPDEATRPSRQFGKTISIPDIYLNSERLCVNLNADEVRPHTPTTILRFANGTPTTCEDFNGLTPRLPSTTSESSAASSVHAFTNFDEKRALLKDMLQKKTNRIWIKGTGTSES